MQFLLERAANAFASQIVFVALLLLCGSEIVAGQGEKQDECGGLTYQIGTYESNGKPIPVEQYRPKKKGKVPVVVMIHGAGGVFSRRDDTGVPELDNFGEKQFACSGFMVLLPHYLESTGQVSALNRGDMARKSPTWLQGLEDAITYASKLRGADRKRIFLFGESLGGYLSIEVAAGDRRIKALSTFGAGLPPGLEIRGIPPVLVQHGEQDEVVRVSEAVKLESELRAMGCTVTLRIFPNLGHYPSRERQRDIAGGAIAFFLSLADRTPKGNRFY